MFLKFLKKKEGRIFLTSFLILFAESVFIRVFPAQVTFLGFYTNFILIASFAGIGLGLLLSKYPFKLANVFPWAMIIVAFLLSFLNLEVAPNPQGEIGTWNPMFVPEFVAVPFIFLLVAAIFSILSQELGRLFDKTSPLLAYKWDILGSLTGVILFAVLSFFETGPILWFGLVFIAFMLLNWDKKKLFLWTSIFVAVLIFLELGVYRKNQVTRWSPYQKLTLQSIEGGYNLSANNILHQYVYNDINRLEEIYDFPYQSLTKNRFDNVLIVGSGMGNDVEVALKNKAKHVDAVEIDPEIRQLGVEYNAAKPYQNPSVTYYNEDGRSFLARTDKKYDLVIFALADTLFLSANRGNIRLESYLFTKESFTAAKEHLTDDGVIALYNFYRYPFIIDKLSLTLKDVFGTDTYIQEGEKGGPPFYEAELMNGPGLKYLKNKDYKSPSFGTSPVLATDDWPFLYLETPHIPPKYLIVLAIVLAIFYFIIEKVIKKPLYKSLEFNYFFLGVGFFLIETKSVVQFSLLFGATWITNALVITAVLTSVYLATMLAMRMKIKSLKPLYFALFFALALQYFFSLDTLLNVDLVTRYLIVSIITFAPVFIANVIFSFTFKDSKQNSLNFASNMFGAVVGGALEYLALVTGYRNLVLIIALCYFLAFATAGKKPFGKLKAASS